MDKLRFIFISGEVPQSGVLDLEAEIGILRSESTGFRRYLQRIPGLA
jgi:hypothetical protein